MDPSPTVEFELLPPEIRNQIYALLLISAKPIQIRSPRKRRIGRKIGSSNFGRLLCVNKRIYEEASTIFYSMNTFVVGNGSWGSTTFTNVHALKAFIKSVPASHISRITKVIMEIHMRISTAWPEPYIFGTRNEASSLHSISRALVRHFTGLEFLCYQFDGSGPVIFQNEFIHAKLSDDQAINELHKVLSTLLKHGTLKRISQQRTWDGKCVDIQSAVKEILLTDPKFDKIIELKETVV